MRLSIKKMTPPHTHTQIKEMRGFEEDIGKMVSSVSFRKVNTEFQNKLRKDIDEITISKGVFVRADKTGEITNHAFINTHTVITFLRASFFSHLLFPPLSSDPCA